MVRLPQSEGQVAAPAVTSWQRIAVLAVVVAAVGAVSVAPLWSTQVVTAAVDTLVAVSFVTTGVVLWDDRAQRGNARALVLCGVFWIISWWWVDQIGPFPFVSRSFGYLWFVFGGLALLRYPQNVMPNRFQRVYIVGLGVWVCACQIAIALASRPEWQQFDPSIWWPAIAPNRAMFNVLMSAFFVVTGILILIMLALLLDKLRRARGVDRIDSIPVTVAAGTVAVGGLGFMVTSLLPHSPDTINAILLGIGCTTLITPLAFLAVVLQRRLARSTVVDLVLGIGLAATPTISQIQTALRKVLRDPSAELWLWLPSQSTYVNDIGQPTATPASDEGWSVPVLGRDGDPLAVLIVAPALRRYPQLVESTVVAAGLALENGRLHADLQRQLVEMHDSRARIAEAGLQERRRIERDLHDGAQQSLLAAAAALGVARLHAGEGEQTKDALDNARASVQSALRDLRDLAHGIHPAVLSQSGLRGALEAITVRLPIPVTMSFPDQRLPSQAESALYFFICEALTNTVKHAKATAATVDVRLEHSSLVVTVADDGQGGAELKPGGGLRGIIDRINALDGNVELQSPSPQGTRLTATLPWKN